MSKEVNPLREFLTGKLPKLLPILVVLVGGLLLRAYHLGNYSFDFDQVQIAENSQRILAGQPTLIGPRTGPAAMFTGPLIYYTTAFFMLVTEPPLAVAGNALFLAVVTGGLIYFLTRRYLDEPTALIMTSLWAFSPFIIKLDRTPWNPNLMLMAAALIFLPMLKKDRLKLVDGGLIGLGVFLGYQAHFAGLLLPPLAIFSLLIRREFSWKPYALVAAGFVTSIVPTILFDLQHNWLNLTGLLGLITNKDNTASYQLLPKRDSR